MQDSFWPCLCPFTGSRCCPGIQVTIRQERFTNKTMNDDDDMGLIYFPL
jgi:hypothetical protein